MPAVTVQQAYELALQHHKAGQISEAESLYRQVLAHDPGHADAVQMLGVLADQSGRTTEAVEWIRQAIRLNPSRASYHNNLGLILANQRQWRDAADAFRAALSINPTFPQSLNNLTNVLREMGQFDEAVVVISKAIESNCASPEALAPLGLTLARQGRVDDAIRILSKLVELRPDPDVLLNLGNALKWQGRLDESNAAYERAIQLRPDFAAAHLNLATNFCSQGDLDRALESFRQAVACGGDDPQFQAGLIHALHYHPAYDAQAILREHVAWAGRFADPLAMSAAQVAGGLPPADSRQTGMSAPPADTNVCPTIKLGYVSADFRDHPVGRFLGPLFSHHDHERFEISCYSSSPTADDVTRELQNRADRWIDVARLSDEQLAQQIREDRIDILVDLGLHTAGSRLLTFARKPAPVQVTWLAYPGTSGMKAMDYRLSDSFLDPRSTSSGQAPDWEQNYVERTIRLPNCFWCYQAPIAAPAVNPLPAQTEGHVTFGSFNNFFKVSPGALELWAKVLASVPRSRMLIHSQPGSHLDRVREIFSRAGVDPRRLEFFGFLSIDTYWRQHHRIDLALDTLPYAGGTTTCDSLWMGVPVVTLAGHTAVGRAGVSILANAGHPEWIAQRPEQYVEIATRLAGDLPRLSFLRRAMREQLVRAPLMDAIRFTADFEEALRRLWRESCGRA